MSRNNDKKECLKAEVIMKVRCGQLNATDAARILGMSRKSYYEWEERGLRGLMDALRDKEPGRPVIPRDPEKIAAMKRISELEEELKMQEARLNICRSLSGSLGESKKN